MVEMSDTLHMPFSGSLSATLVLFFQFNDVLLYTSRGLTACNQFKVHGQLPLYGMTVSSWAGHRGVRTLWALKEMRPG